MLNEKLKRISKRRELHRLQRQRLNIGSISLAGYTGVGKTTLFNQLTAEERDVDKGVFTTLTTSTRALNLFDSKVLISDTVGFISRLPTYMIESFRSTLEELTYANLVLLILDSSENHTDFLKKYKSCIDILAELHVSPSRVVLVFNKCDLTNEDELERKIRSLGATEEKSAIVSAKRCWGMEHLKSVIQVAVLEYIESRITLTQEDIANLPQHLGWLQKNATVGIKTNSDGTATALIKGPLWVIDRFRAQIDRS